MWRANSSLDCNLFCSISHPRIPYFLTRRPEIVTQVSIRFESFQFDAGQKSEAKECNDHNSENFKNPTIVFSPVFPCPEEK